MKSSPQSEQLKAMIKGDFGRNIINMDTVDSTNSVAMYLADKGAQHGTVVLSESQTKGKGRLGRHWESPGGMNIYMSLILRPTIKTEDATLLTVIAAVGCARAIIEAADINVGIKWPNDLMSGDKKLGGILTEIKSVSGDILFSVTGIGINVNTELEGLPSGVRPIATSVCSEAIKSGKGEAVSNIRLLRDSLISGALNEMGQWYSVTVTEGRKPLLDEWRRLTSTLGKALKVKIGEEVVTGVAEDIDEYGMLLLRLQSGGLKRISSGDVTLLQ